MPNAVYQKRGLAEQSAQTSSSILIDFIKFIEIIEIIL